MQFVLDTNVLISSALGNGPCRNAFDFAQQKGQLIRDSKDDMFLELAVSSRADAIVNRDGDLHSLNPFRGIPIVTISNFTKMFS